MCQAQPTSSRRNEMIASTDDENISVAKRLAKMRVLLLTALFASAVAAPSQVRLAFVPAGASVSWTSADAQAGAAVRYGSSQDSLNVTVSAVERTYGTSFFYDAVLTGLEVRIWPDAQGLKQIPRAVYAQKPLPSPPHQSRGSSRLASSCDPRFAALHALLLPGSGLLERAVVHDRACGWRHGRLLAHRGRGHGLEEQRAHDCVCDEGHDQRR